MNLQEQLLAAIAASEKAFNDGNVDEGNAKLKEAESIKARLDGVAKAAAMRPTLPGAGEGNLPKLDPAQPAGDPAVKAAYVKRFGAADDDIKAILTDLHGADYQSKYWAQKSAFTRYIRGGEKALDFEQRKLLKEIVFTPAAIKAALDQGVADVKVLKSTMVEASDTLGGYVVPVDFQARVIERLAGYTVVRPRANVISTTRDKIEMPKATGGDSQYPNAVRITMVDETPTAGAAATNLTYGLESIPIFTAMAETPVSLNMLEDAAYPVEQHLARAFAEAAAIEEDNQFLAGDGNGKPQGILPGSANALSLSYGHNTTATNAVEWDGIIDTVYEIDSQYRQNAVWIAEKATYRDIAKLKSDNAYLWKQDQQAGQARSLEGYPVLEQEQMPSVAANAYVAIFGDLRGYTIADRVGMSIERFDDSAVRRQNMTMFFMRRRYGGKVMEPWRFVLYKIATS